MVPTAARILCNLAEDTKVIQVSSRALSLASRLARSLTTNGKPYNIKEYTNWSRKLDQRLRLMLMLIQELWKC